MRDFLTIFTSINTKKIVNDDEGKKSRIMGKKDKLAVRKLQVLVFFSPTKTRMNDKNEEKLKFWEKGQGGRLGIMNV